MKQFSKILCVVDPEKTMHTAIVQAVRIAEDHQADITFISVLKAAKAWRTAFGDKEEYHKSVEQVVANKRTAIQREIQLLAPAMTPEIVVSSGIAFIDIIQRVIHHQHDLVVKCVDDTDRLLGSEDMHLLRKCPCPVLLLTPQQKASFRKVLATVDVNNDASELDEGRVQDQLNQQVLEYSAALSIPELSEMHIGCAWEAYAEDFLRYSAFSRQPEEKVDELVEHERRECLSRLELLVTKMDNLLGKAAVQYLQPRSHLVKGKAANEIPLMVDNYGIDLIVMGTVGRVGIPGLLIGNTAESILEKTRCSVLAIKPEGFKTPVV